MEERYLSSEALRVLETQIGKSSVESWFKGATVSTSASGLVLMFPSSFVKSWVSDNYSDQLMRAVYHAYGTTDVSLKVGSASVKVKDGEFSDASLPLNRKMVFSSFVVGEANQMAYASSKSVTENYGAFSPLFLHGDSGNGKTHLMNSIAWNAFKDGKKVCYISAEQYMMAFIKSLKEKDVISFKRSFREVDILLIDDLQFMDNKDATQEELLHTLNYLAGSEKQIVLSSDRPPCELKGIEARLRSRLSGGLIVNLQRPSHELKLQILQHKAREYKKVIDLEVLQMICSNIDGSVRELEGALLRLYAQMEFFNEEVTAANARAILKDMFMKTENELSVELIIQRVCQFYQVEQSMVTSSSRARDVVKARQVAMFMARHVGKKSLPEIGKHFGSKDHTKALYSIRQVEQKSADSKFSKELDQVRRSVQR